MDKYEIEGLDQVVYYEKLDNGLEVFLAPFTNKKNYIMTYGTKFGSLYTTFIPYDENKYVTVPDGIAHFLEHKMFEQEDGVDPFNFASKSGTYSNAATDFDSTKYYFEGNKNFKENLDFLLNFVGSPYFTDSNVEKEKGIIAEEIKQYDDDIGWFMEEEMYKALLHKDNHRIDIAGTVESINKITKEDLYKTYYTFYQPSNMFLVISGCFDVDEAINTIKNNKVLNSAKTNIDIKVEEIDEPLEVVDKYKELSFNINNVKMVYSYKIPIEDMDVFDLKIYTSILLDNKFGGSSLFRERLKEKELYTRFFASNSVVGKYLIISFHADTNNPNELVEEIKKELSNIDISDIELERIKKVWIASTVMGSDDIGYINSNIFHDVINYGKVHYDVVKRLKMISKNEYLRIINGLNFENSSFIVVKPNK